MFVDEVASVVTMEEVVRRLHAIKPELYRIPQ